MSQSVRELLEDLSVPEPNSGCHLWLSSIDRGGYGLVNIGRKLQKAHRVAYQEFIGEIPEGFAIDHLCRTRLCINPDHLEAVTNQENTLRGVGHAAVNARKTECPSGHPYSEENIRWAKHGNHQQRKCLTCYPVVTGLGKHSERTHCIRGHPFNEENTYYNKLGHRSCRACNRAAVAAYQKRKTLEQAS